MRYNIIKLLLILVVILNKLNLILSDNNEDNNKQDNIDINTVLMEFNNDIIETIDIFKKDLKDILSDEESNKETDNHRRQLNVPEQEFHDAEFDEQKLQIIQHQQQLYNSLLNDPQTETYTMTPKQFLLQKQSQIFSKLTDNSFKIRPLYPNSIQQALFVKFKDEQNEICILYQNKIETFSLLYLTKLHNLLKTDKIKPNEFICHRLEQAIKLTQNQDLKKLYQGMIEKLKGAAESTLNYWFNKKIQYIRKVVTKSTSKLWSNQEITLVIKFPWKNGYIDEININVDSLNIDTRRHFYEFFYEVTKFT